MALMKLLTRGKKRILKTKVSVQALQCLSQICHVILSNKNYVNANDVLRRADIKVSGRVALLLFTERGQWAVYNTN